MNSMPLIEGLNSSSNINELYAQFLSDLQAFFSSYQAYVNCNSTSGQKCDTTVLMNNYYALVGNPSIMTSGTDAVASQGSMINLQNAIADNPTNGDSVAMNAKLQNLRKEFDEKAAIITDVKNSAEGDYVLKQESDHYYKILISIAAGCVLYYTFFEISSSQ